MSTVRCGSFCVLAFTVALHRRTVAVYIGSSFYVIALVLPTCQRSRWHVNQILCWLKMQTHPNPGGDSNETPWHGCIKGVTRDNSECVGFPLTLKQTHKRIPSLRLDYKRLLLHLNRSSRVCLNGRLQTSHIGRRYTGQSTLHTIKSVFVKCE